MGWGSTRVSVCISSAVYNATADPPCSLAAIWTPLLPHLPASTRFIAYNQRSYSGSSPAFQSEKEGATDATAAYLGDLLAFLGWSVEEFGLPGVDDATGEGGVVLLVSILASAR